MNLTPIIPEYILPLQIAVGTIPLEREADKGHITGLSTATLAQCEYTGMNGYTPLPIIDLDGKVPVILHMAITEQAIRLGARGIFRVMLNRLDPQSGDIADHTDGALPGNPVRYHLPIFTNEGVRYWETGMPEPIHLPLGYWAGPINYQTRHWIYNKGRTPRVHCLVDFYL